GRDTPHSEPFAIATLQQAAGYPFVPSSLCQALCTAFRDTLNWLISISAAADLSARLMTWVRNAEPVEGTVVSTNGEFSTPALNIKVFMCCRSACAPIGTLAPWCGASWLIKSRTSWS